MFGLFKSLTTRRKQACVYRVGEDILRQISIFRDKCQSGEFTEQDFEDGINQAYTAGYIIGFIDEKLSDLFGSNILKAKYMDQIVSKIFPIGGIGGHEFLRDKYAARKMADELRTSKRFDIKVQHFIEDFDSGMDDGRSELKWFDEDGSYVPHLLTDFLAAI